MKKQQLVATYNANHKLPARHKVTGVMVLTDEQVNEQVNAYKKYGKKSLFEVYTKPSELKIAADEALTRAYSPTEAYYNGNCFAFNVFLKNQYGDYMLITKDNNYLVVVE